MAEPTEAAELPQASVRPVRRGRISVVWVVPILAALVALGIAVQRMLREGPTISIVLRAASGIEAGKTFIKYKDVNIGQVTSVKLTDDYSKVTVTAQMDKSATGLMVDDARFWVVEPRVTLSGISGLGTLLSGNYIGFEAGTSTKSRRDFVGLAVAPVVTGDQPGRQFVLRAQSLGSLAIGAPVYYRSLQAGQVVGYQLTEDGNAIEVRIFVNAPYDKYVNSGTRFWNASGIDVALGADGLTVRSQSLVALLAGGLAFETPPFAADTAAAAANAVFTLYVDQPTALKQPDAVATRYVMYFSESLRGLSVGAPVTLLGLPGGTVTDVGLDIEPATLKVRGRVEVVAYPERMVERMERDKQPAGLDVAQNRQRREALIRRLVEQGGLRAQLRNGNLLTGQLYVALDFFPRTPKVRIDWSKQPVELPVVLSPLPQIEDRLNSILAKIDAVQFQAIGSDLRSTMVTANRLIAQADTAIERFNTEITPEVGPALQAFKDASASASKVLNSSDASLLSADAPAQQDLRNALQEFSRAARSLRVLLDSLERNPEQLIRGKTEARQ